MEQYTPKQKMNAKDEQIAFAQSWNLAVNLLSGQNPNKAMIEKWQEYFFDKLTAPQPICKICGGVKVASQGEDARQESQYQCEPCQKSEFFKNKDK